MEKKVILLILLIILLFVMFAGADVRSQSEEGANAAVYALFFAPENPIESILDNGQDVNETYMDMLS
jgi:hypothetical protein